jgi:hypothetical protein
VFLQLVRNLAPEQRPVLRIGGDSTDRTWWPVPGVRQPRGVAYALTRRWLRSVRAVANALHARLILDVNLAADSRRVARVEARALIGGIGRRSIEALELGNEPELYASFPWHVTSHGRHVPARGSGWSFDRYLGDFGRISRAVPSRLLAGPATGSPNWMSELGRFLHAERRVGLLTVHRYAMKRCGASSNSTVRELLANSAADGLAASVVPTVAIARSHRVPLRIDEVNSIACGGQPGVSNTFGADPACRAPPRFHRPPRGRRVPDAGAASVGWLPSNSQLSQPHRQTSELSGGCVVLRRRRDGSSSSL